MASLSLFFAGSTHFPHCLAGTRVSVPRSEYRGLSSLFLAATCRQTSRKNIRPLPGVTTYWSGCVVWGISPSRFLRLFPGTTIPEVTGGGPPQAEFFVSFFLVLVLSELLCVTLSWLFAPAWV